jgi:hypothetical protein
VNEKYATIIAIITLGGFAIQQVLQVADIPISWAIARVTKGGIRIPSGMLYGDFKKGVMTLLAFVIALITTLVFKEDVRTLTFASDDLKSIDPIVTALILSAGTEGTNTLLKYFSYIKDGRRRDVLDDEVEVTIG